MPRKRRNEVYYEERKTEEQSVAAPSQAAPPFSVNHEEEPLLDHVRSLRADAIRRRADAAHIIARLEIMRSEIEATIAVLRAEAK